MWDVKKLYSFNISDEVLKLATTVPELEGAEGQIQRFKSHISPAVHWMDMEIHHKDEGCISMGDLDGDHFTIESAYVARGLSDCQRVTLIAATIGREISQVSMENYSKGQFWEGTIADYFGSYAMEILVEKFHKHLIGNQLSKGFFSTLRFSPGYGDWHLQDQKKILTLLDTQPAITVNSFSILEPSKSITALVGWSRIPQTSAYPMGRKSKGLCEGKTNCQHCNTWACKG